MDNKAFANFFITFEPVLDEVRMKKIQNKVGEMQKGLFDNIREDIKKFQQSVKKDTNQTFEDIKKEGEKAGKGTADVFGKHFKSIFQAMTKITLRAVAMSSVLGGLALLQNSQIYELDNNLKTIKDNSQEVYKYMSASNKILGISREGVADELNQLVKSRQKRIATGENDKPELALFGASVDDNMEVILKKFREKIRSMSDVEGKIFAEKTGLSNIYEIAKLDDDRFNQLTQSFLYQKDHIEKMKKAGEATKELLASLGEVKDEMVVSFSPIVVGVLQTISRFLKSALIDQLMQALGGLGEDIVRFNDALSGLPFALLIGLLASIAVSLSPIGAGIMALIVVIQDILRAISGTKLGALFGMEDRSESSLIGSAITNKIGWMRRDMELYDPSKTSNYDVSNGKNLIDIASGQKKPKTIDYEFLKNVNNSSKSSNITNNNKNFKQNNNVNVNVNVSNTNAKPDEIGGAVANKIKQTIFSQERMNNLMSAY